MPTSPQSGATGPEPALAPGDTASFLRLTAHELRQPLSTIDSIACYLDLVLPPAESKARMQATKLQTLVAQLNGILSDALYFLQAVPVQLQLLDLAGLAPAAGRQLRDVEGIECRLALESRPLWVLADPDQLHHLLRNLLRFCARAAPAGQTPEAAIARADGRVRLQVSVAATGFAGLEPELMFQPFAPHLPPGSGLALAGARRIAEANGGSLEAHTSPSGLSFIAEFPEASLDRTSRMTASGA